MVLQDFLQRAKSALYFLFRFSSVQINLTLNVATSLAPGPYLVEERNTDHLGISLFFHFDTTHLAKVTLGSYKKKHTISMTEIQNTTNLKTIVVKLKSAIQLIYLLLFSR